MTTMIGFTSGLLAGLLTILTICSIWRVFEKAGRPGWAMFIPFYNLYNYAKVAGFQGMSFLLMFIPFLNIFYWFGVNIHVARKFGYSDFMGVLLAVFPWLAMPILAFGDNSYKSVDNTSASVAAEQPSRKKKSTSNIIIDEDGNHVEQIRLEDW